MNIQTIIVFALFVLAVVYVARMIYRMVNAKKSCGGNCKCGVDFSSIQPKKND